MNKKILSLELLTLGLASLSANAAVTWSITTTNGSNATPSYGNTRAYNNNVDVNVTAFSSTGGTSNNTAANDSRNSHTLETAYLSNYEPTNGLGVVNRDGSNTSAVAVSATTGTDGREHVNGGVEHSMDNNGRSDVMLLTFTDMVALNSLKLGFPDPTKYDSDMFVLAWVGPVDPSTHLVKDKTFAGISTDTANGGDGWSLIANLSNVATNTNKTASFNIVTPTNPVPVSSRYWLIGTGGFSSAATGGGVTSGDKSGQNWIAFGRTGASYDYVKLAGIGGTKTETQVPEPGTLGLAGVALFAISALRRRKKTN